MRVILHAGFHKTGTSTAQATLNRNRSLLAQHVRVILRPGMVAVCESARAWSVSRDALDLALFQYELAQLAEGWKQDDPRPVLLAAEDLCGHMPGRRGLNTYDAAPQLMQTLVETLREICPEVQPELFFSTRAAAPWLASCYSQNLHATRLTLSQQDYVVRFAASAELDDVVDRITAAVTPCPVHRCALENSRNGPLGPLDPVLDVIGLPAQVRAKLKAAPLANAAPAMARLDQLLALNRSDLDHDALRDAKRALTKGQGSQSETRAP